MILAFKEFKYISIIDLVGKILDNTNDLEYLKEADEEYRVENIRELK